MLVGKRACAAITAALFVLAEAHPASAVQPRYDGPAVVTGALSLSVTLLPMAVIALMSSEKAKENAYGIEITLYTSSSVGLALAGTTFGLEAISVGRCPKDCRAALASAGVGTGLGLFGLAIAAIASYQRTHPKRRSRAWMTPAPIAIDAICGPAIGAGIVGVTF